MDLFLFVCWFRKIFNVETTIIKKEFCKIFKAKIYFVASSVGDDTLSEFGNDIHNECLSVCAIFAHEAIEPIALTFSIETLARTVVVESDVEETRISWCFALIQQFFRCKTFRVWFVMLIELRPLM